METSWTGSRLSQVSVSGDGSHVWGVNSNNHIYYRNGVNDKNWKKYSGELKQIDVGGRNGKHVWGVGVNNFIYYFNFTKNLPVSNSTSKKVQVFTLGKCGLKLDKDIGNNEKDAVWDCNGNADTLELVNNKLYRHIGNTKCGFEWESDLINGERNAKFDCKGTADPINIQGNKIYTYVGSTKCGLEWDSQLKNNKRNAKWDCKGTADAVEIEISNPKPVVIPAPRDPSYQINWLIKDNDKGNIVKIIEGSYK